MIFAIAAEAAIAKINPYGAIDVGSSPLAAQLAGLRMAAIGALAGSLSLPTIAKVPLLIGCGGLSLAYVNCGSLMGAITSLSFLIVAFAAAHADEAQFVARRLTETTSPRDEPARAIDPPRSTPRLKARKEPHRQAQHRRTACSSLRRRAAARPLRARSSCASSAPLDSD